MVKRMMRRSAALTIIAMAALAVGAAEAAEPAAPLAPVLEQYASIHDALAADRIDGVTGAAAKIAELAGQASAGKAGEQAWMRLATAAGAMSGSDIAALREQLNDLSKAMAAVVETTGTSAADLYYCPMVGRYWLQKKGDNVRRNPYFGKSMLGCGEKVDKVED